MTLTIWTVDAFAAEPFTGNPAAVCILPAYPDDAMLQKIAAEMNLSETAFLVRNAAFDYQLRWFTPAVEVALCGHATLAATHMLCESGLIKTGDKVTYRTLSGDLYASAKQGMVEIELPSLPGEPTVPHPALKALGVEILACERNRENYLVEVKNKAALAACSPDFKELAALNMQGVIVTTATDIEGFDFASRYFAPGVGIDEDPVTGSAHSFLAPYWAKKLGRYNFHALQASKRRGVLEVMLMQDRVRLSGRAITMLLGQLQLPVNLMEIAA